jgi:hypothetical protein
MLDHKPSSRSLPSFPLGIIEATPAALDALKAAGMDFLDVVSRHAQADWGDVDAWFRRANNRALHAGGRLHSAYLLPTGAEVWVITNTRRTETLLLLPEEK